MEALLLPVVFGHVVGQPVHFGLPALAEGFVELHAEVLQRLLLRLPQRQRVLGRTTKALTRLGPAPRGKPTRLPGRAPSLGGSSVPLKGRWEERATDVSLGKSSLF